MCNYQYSQQNGIVILPRNENKIWINEKLKKGKNIIYACCLFGSSLGFPFGAQQN